MRNTGSHISNNTYHSNEIRGGEKKVMKKSLSVILSTTMALSAFSTAALAATSKDFSDLDKLSAADKAIFDKLIEDGIFLGVGEGKFGVDEAMKRDQFAVAIVKAFGLTADATTSSFPDVKEDAPELRFIEAAYKAGIANGNKNGTFAPKDEVSVQELAVFLVGSLGPKYKDEARAATGNLEGVADWAQGYVATALKYNLLAVEEGFDGFASATRYQLAKGVAAAQAKYAEDHKPPYATKVESVKATNLAQVFVTFDGQVDKASAEEVDNYALNDSKNIRSATLSEDGKMVTLELDTPNSVFVNQKEYKLTINNVRAGENVISVNDYAFTPLDVEVPAVVSVTPLGNSTIKFKFSEPIKAANSTVFKIDDKVVLGSTDIISDTVILKLYSKLSDGDHTVTVKGASDFNNLLSLESQHQFTVVADNTPPEIDSIVSATFEKVTVKFSEPVDKDTVFANSAYWVEGSNKRYANAVKQISDDTYEFDFSNFPIRYTTDLFITGVKDYSGNTIAADSKISVSPVIDQTRPEITVAKYDGDIPGFSIKFNKSLDRDSAEKTANYVLKNSKGEEVHKYKTVSLNYDNRTVQVKLLGTLAAGNYTLEVSGVMDNTTLKNSIMPYSKTIEVGDTAQPTVPSGKAVYNLNSNTLYVTFDKTMAVSGEGSIVEKNKYFYTTDSNLATATWKQLPDGSSVGPSPDGKTAVVQLPNNPGDLKVDAIKGLRVQLVMGTNGKYTRDLINDLPVIAQQPVNILGAKTTAKNKIQVELDQAILSNTLTVSEFRVTTAAGQVLNVINGETDGTKVNLTLSNTSELNDDGTFGNGHSPVYVSAGGPNTRTSTVDGSKINPNTVAVDGKIAVGISSLNGKGDGKTIVLAFNGNIDASVSTVNAAHDLIIYQEDRDKARLQANSDYTISIADNIVTITLTEANYTGPGLYSIGINPAFLKSNGVLVASVDAHSRLVNVEDVRIATLTGVTNTNVPGAGNDNKVKVNIANPAATGNVFVYKVGTVTAPVTGEVLTTAQGWNPIVDGGEITAASGTLIHVAEVNSVTRTAVKYMNMTSLAQNHVPATAGTLVGAESFADNAAVEAATVAENTNVLEFTVDGDTANVLTLTISDTVKTKNDLITAINGALNGKAEASFEGNVIKVVSKTTGSSSSVNVAGSAATAFFGAAQSTPGADAQN